MPPLITSLPWLNQEGVDPVASYQRSQQLVQQMEAQRAQQQQQQAELSLRAQENAMQAGFQQRALALKEQEARSSVQLEADRLRQRGQAQAFEEQQAAIQNQILSAPPEVVQLPDMPAAIQYRGRVQFPPQAPDISSIGQTVPVYEGNVPTGRVLGNVAMTSGRGGAFVPVKTGPTAEEQGLAAAGKEFTAQQRAAQNLDKRLLVKEQDKLAEHIKPGSQFWEESDPASRTNTLQRFSDIQRRLDTYRQPPKAPEKPKPKAERRAELANQLEAANPSWTSAEITAEVYRRIP